MKVNANDIKILPNRQRTEYNDFDTTIGRASDLDALKAMADHDTRIPALVSLMDSIVEHGLIEDIVVDTKLVLIAGERRTRACQLLGRMVNAKYLTIEAKQKEPRDDFDRWGIELHENIERDALTKPERAVAVAEYHRLRQLRTAKTTTADEKPARHGVRDTAKELGMSVGNVSEMQKIAKILALAPHLRSETSYKSIADRFRREVINAIRAEQARRSSTRAATSLQLCDTLFINADGPEYLRGLEPDTVDFVFADGPYGISVDATGGFRTQGDTKQWDDSLEAATEFYHRLVGSISHALRPGRHALIMCGWELCRYIKRLCEPTDLTFDTTLLYWDKVTAVASKVPAYKGDAQIEEIIHLYKGSPTFPASIGRNLLRFTRLQKQAYPTQKPPALLEHLVRKFTHPGELIVDPCCGSGGLVTTALHAKRRAIGCDTNAKAIELAKQLYLDAEQQGSDLSDSTNEPKK